MTPAGAGPSMSAAFGETPGALDDCKGFCREYRVVRIRMQRLGRRHRPFYRIGAVDSRVKRDGKVLESLGWYDPIAKEEDKQLSLNGERIQHWLSQGAIPSETVADLLAKNDLLPEKLKAEWEGRRQRRRDLVQKRIDAKTEAERAEAEKAAAAAAAAEAEKAKAEAAKAEAEAAKAAESSEG